MDVAAAERLLDLLNARRGLVAATGAGGKKSTLRRLLDAHLCLGNRPLAMTATVLLARPATDPRVVQIAEPPDQLAAPVRAASGQAPAVAYAGPEVKPGRLDGVAPELIAELHAACGFRVTLVKADGARMRLIKAPRPGEPVLPPGCGTVLPVVSAQAIGRPLDGRIAHRVERLAAVLGIPEGAPIDPQSLARLLASDDGALRGTGDATVVPVINAVDDREREDLARAAARLALSATARFDRVVLAAMARPGDPVVDLVTR